MKNARRVPVIASLLAVTLMAGFIAFWTIGPGVPLGAFGVRQAEAAFGGGGAGLLPFGGQIQTILPCQNGSFLIKLGPPTPGPYIYTLGTKTYDYGRPSHPGQWLLGTASGPGVCMIGETAFPGLKMTMVGSSR